MANNPIVTSLPQYVEENKSALIAKSVLGSKSASLLTLYSGIKGDTTLNLINTDVVLQDGAECGFNAEGSTTLTQRVLKPSLIKSDVEYCDKNLLNTYAQYQVEIAANRKSLPFEEHFVNGVLNGIDEAIEKMIWQGDSANTPEFDGLIKVLTDASAPTTSATGAYETIKAVYMAIPANVVDKEDATIFVGADTYRQFIQDLVAANLYHYDPTNGADGYKVPGTNVSVVAVNGLNGTSKVIAARKSNLFLGVDLMSDSEAFDLWFSKDNRTFRMAVEFLMGVQVAYPNEVVLGTIA